MIEKNFVSSNSQGFHKVVYSDWGNKNARPIICVPGLTGNGRDFDVIAPELVKDGYRVIAVDLPGRGRSDFLPNPLDYNYHQYCKDLTCLLDTLDLHEVDWLGVSLGGLLGIKIAGEAHKPIRRLILNDVGPTVPKPALDFIHSVISQTYKFKNLEAMEKRMRETRGLTWGPVTDDQWKAMARDNARPLPGGSITYSYDPAIAVIFETQPIGDTDLWPYWDDIVAPTLLIHGAKSVILTKDIVKEMKDRMPAMDYVVFKDAGHVPSLMAPDQIEVIRQWLNTTQI
jgi:pimeloyl-ACP methyl ester carboxylesterase